MDTFRTIVCELSESCTMNAVSNVRNGVFVNIN